MKLILTVSVLAAAALPVTASAQDWSVLERPGTLDPQSTLGIETLPPGIAVPRVLLAGDSWAQFMWDDGSHNLIFDRYGHADKMALSQSVADFPTGGYNGTAYAISGSEARQWVDTGTWPFLANAVNGLNANPTIDHVMLSIGGNDFLAAKSGGGWYKDMDLDIPGSEAAFFATLEANTATIINTLLAVRPEMQVLISSYDYPNFNVGSLCEQYACPRRRDLSRDPVNDLITDQEINAIMATVEQTRAGWANADSRVGFDNSIGLMHYFYGDGQTGPLLLPRPGTVAPSYAPLPGGNVLRPTLRSNFRPVVIIFSFDADPIHLNVAGYQRKIAQQTEGYFFPEFRGDALATFFSEGGTRDGWTDGTSTGTAEIRVGDTGVGLYSGIVSFDTSSLPDGATVTDARFYLTRQSATGTNPFASGALGYPRVDIKTGSFGNPDLEASDNVAAADYPDAGYLAGSLSSNGSALGVQIDPAALGAINTSGLTQFRLSFPSTGGGSGADATYLYDGDATTPPTTSLPTLAAYMGTAQPFLDVTYEVQIGVGDDPAPSAMLLANSPNPFRSSTSIRFLLPEAGRVRLRVFDVLGRRVATLKDEAMTAGGHAVTWTGENDRGMRVGAGVYLAVLEAGGETSTRRLVVLDR